jgi:hypothetical protein
MSLFSLNPNRKFLRWLLCLRDGQWKNVNFRTTAIPFASRFPMKDPYQTYWKLLEPHLAGVNTIYFSPDGIYNKVNMLTLFDPERKQYLIDRLSLKLVGNPRDLLLKTGPASASPQAVLLGYPDYLKNATEDHTHLSLSAENTSAAFQLVRGGIAPLAGHERRSA